MVNTILIRVDKDDRDWMKDWFQENHKKFHKDLDTTELSDRYLYKAMRKFVEDNW
jgi:hypothetical protein